MRRKRYGELMKSLILRRAAALVPLCAVLLLALGRSEQEGAKKEEEFDWTTVDSQAEQAGYILARLEEWRDEDRPRHEKKLRIVYFRPKDRKPLSKHVARWDGIMSDIQQFYRTEMKRLGFGELTLGVERKEGTLRLHEVAGSANDDGTYSYRSGGRIRQEVNKALAAKGIDPKEETLLIVCGLSKTEDKKVTIYSPYYGMGADHNRGICFVADSDWLKIDGLKPEAKEIKLSVKEHRGYEPFSLPRFNTTYIGGTIHELGHGLSLPHNHATKKEAERGTALMGAGNYTYRQEWRNEGKGSFLTLAHAIRLAVHPLFSGTTQQAQEKPELRIKSLEVTHAEGEIHLRGQLEAAVPAVAMVAYNDGENRGQKRYQVNNDYDATTWTSVVNPQNEFWIRIGDLKDGNHQIRLLSVHANGATVTHLLHYRVKDGVPELGQMRGEIAKIVGE